MNESERLFKNAQDSAEYSRWLEAKDEHENLPAMTNEKKLADLNAASAVLTSEREAVERALNLRVSIKLAEQVRANGKLPGNAPQCLGSMVSLLEEIERLNGLRPLDQTDRAAIDAAWQAHKACRPDNVGELFRELEKEGAITRAPEGRDPAADELAPKHPYPMCEISLAPWRVDQIGGRSIFAADGTRVATLSVFGELNPADGKLLAAAPQLLAALKKIEQITDADNADSYRSDAREGCLDTVYTTALAAIAAATK